MIHLGVLKKRAQDEQAIRESNSSSANSESSLSHESSISFVGNNNYQTQNERFCSTNNDSATNNNLDKNSNNSYSDTNNNINNIINQQKSTKCTEESSFCSSFDDDDETGYLLHIYQGRKNAAENITFRKICMRYGLQAWDEMHTYLPWRSRADLRSTLMKMIKKQAISEYGGIKADPAQIHKDNNNLEDENYKMKGGLLINQRWDISPTERASVRSENKVKYNMRATESLNVDITPIMNVNYIQSKMKMRKLSLLLFRAGLANEKARRTNDKKPKLGLENVVFMPSKRVKVRRTRTKLDWNADAQNYIFDVPNFKD